MLAWPRLPARSGDHITQSHPRVDRLLDKVMIRSHIVAKQKTGFMASDTVVRARIDGQVKERAAKVLADMSLSVSYAIRLLLVRVAAEKALPFEVKVPNAETRAVISEPRARSRHLVRQRGRTDDRSERGGLSALPHFAVRI